MWEDTVMDEGRMLGCSLRGTYGFEAVKDVILDTAIAQAKITWDKAIREVVEWIEDNAVSGFSGERATLRFFKRIDQDEWIAQKKVWGIKNESKRC